jgi:pimeloyl-ACP methyl ester carboxylesterase
MLVAACATASGVHTSRADPLGSAPLVTNSDGTTAPTGPTDTVVPNGSMEWHECDDPSAQDPELSCTTLSVPLDYDHPDGDTIQLALVRVEATGDRKGAILFNPGGPGGSGFDPIAFSGTSIAAAMGLGDFDLIGFDPRGVDRSNGIRCLTDEFMDKHLYVDDTPDTPEEQALKDEADAGFVDACRQKYGDTLRFYSTANTARDMDVIRQALGDEQISYIGISYGTYLGATYATMFPDHVRAMVLDSAYEPNGDTVEQQYTTQLVGFEGAFNNWIEWCQTASQCPFNASDVGARWDALKQRLDDAPLTGSDGRQANNATLETATGAALYSESDWPVLAKALADAENGDPAGLFALADSYEGRNDDGTFTTLFQSFPVIQCASGIEAQPPPDPEALAAQLREAAPRFGKDITAEDLSSGSDDCNQLVGDVQPVQLSYAGDGPIVVVGGTNDPATPIRWAQKMTEELGPNARLVTYTGEGHGQLLVSSCVTDIEAALLTDLKLPSTDTTCEPDPVVPKPDWWADLPTPDGVSAVADLPAVAAGIGAMPTQFFSELRTTSMTPDEAIEAYKNAYGSSGLERFDLPDVLPIDDTAQIAFTDFDSRGVVVVALGPQAFEDEALQSAKVDVPAGTTVVWVIAIPT